MNRIAIALATASLLAFGCEEKKPAAPVTPGKTPVPAPSSTPPAAPSKTGSSTPTAPAIPGVSPDATKGLTDMAAGAKQKVVDGYQKLLDETKATVDGWTSKVSSAPADKKPAMQTALDGVTSKWNDAKTKLSDFKSSTSTDWQKLQGDVQTAFDNLKKQITDAQAMFQ